MILFKKQHCICIISPDSKSIKWGWILGEDIPGDEEIKQRERKGDRRWFSKILLCYESPQRSSSESLSSKVRKNCQLSSEPHHHPSFHSETLWHARPLVWGLHAQQQRFRLRLLRLLCALTSVILGEAIGKAHYNASHQTDSRGHKAVIVFWLAW